MNFIETASINILSGLVSNPSIIQIRSDRGFDLANCTEDQLCLWAVQFAQNLEQRIKAIDPAHNPEPCPHKEALK